VRGRRAMWDYWDGRSLWHGRCMMCRAQSQSIMRDTLLRYAFVVSFATFATFDVFTFLRDARFDVRDIFDAYATSNAQRIAS
jgi:hypothetical protein